MVSGRQCNSENKDFDVKCKICGRDNPDIINETNQDDDDNFDPTVAPNACISDEEEPKPSKVSIPAPKPTNSSVGNTDELAKETEVDETEPCKNVCSLM